MPSNDYEGNKNDINPNTIYHRVKIIEDMIEKTLLE